MTLPGYNFKSSLLLRKLASLLSFKYHADSFYPPLLEVTRINTIALHQGLILRHHAGRFHNVFCVLLSQYLLFLHHMHYTHYLFLYQGSHHSPVTGSIGCFHSQYLFLFFNFKIYYLLYLNYRKIRKYT